jgi:hypothetical protein
MATKPTESIEWASHVNALKEVTCPKLWYYGWNTTDGNPLSMGEVPNLNQLNYWQNSIYQHLDYVSDTSDQIKAIDTMQRVRNWFAPQINDTVPWDAVCWSPELGIFCMISMFGGGTFSTSKDGILWTNTSGPTPFLYSICWSPELNIFCATGFDSVLTSPDGVSWTARTAASATSWASVCWSPELNLFCSIADALSGDRIMTSPDGINWTLRTVPVTATWKDVCWSPELGLFCVVASTNKVLLSSNGIDWTSYDSILSGWGGVCWSPELGLFCAVSETPANGEIMTSPDGQTWTVRTGTGVAKTRVCWASGLNNFCAVGGLGAYRVSTSPDGINWTNRTTAGVNALKAVCYSPELKRFCASGWGGTSSGGVDNKLVTSL